MFGTRMMFCTLITSCLAYGCTAFGSTYSAGPSGGDYTIWRDALSRGSVAVPEPSTLLLVLLGLVGGRRS